MFLQNTTVIFDGNTAGSAGAAIFASDMSPCTWYGDDLNVSASQPIFVPIPNYNSPFQYRYVCMCLCVSPYLLTHSLTHSDCLSISNN